MRLFQFDSPFFQKLNSFCDLIFLNLLTLVCSLPVITAGAAFTALYYSVDRLRQQEGHLFRAYFQSFKLNFRQATILWLILLVIGIGIVLCLFYYTQAENLIFVAFTALSLLLWGIVLSWLFPLLAKFTCSTLEAFRNALLCGISYMPRSLLMALMSLLPLIAFLFFPERFIDLSFMWLFIWFAFAAYCNLGLLRKPFAELSPKEEPDGESIPEDET